MEWEMGNWKVGNSGQRYNIGASSQILYSLTQVGFSSAVLPAWKVRVFRLVLQLLISESEQK